MIPGYKRHSLDEFTSEAKRLKTQNREGNGHNGEKKTRGRVKIKIEVMDDIYLGSFFKANPLFHFMTFVHKQDNWSCLCDFLVI